MIIQLITPFYLFMNLDLLHITYPLTSESETVKTIIESRFSCFLNFGCKSEVDSENDSQSDGDESKEVQNKPTVIYGSYFQINLAGDKNQEGIVPNVFSGAVGSTLISSYVFKAKQIFSRLFPDEEFLPRAPDPSEDKEEEGEEVSEPQDAQSNEVIKDEEKMDTDASVH